MANIFGYSLPRSNRITTLLVNKVYAGGDDLGEGQDWQEIRRKAELVGDLRRNIG